MLAAALDIRFLWLPKQAPELNAMDQLWRELKRLIAAKIKLGQLLRNQSWSADDGGERKGDGD